MSKKTSEQEILTEEEFNNQYRIASEIDYHDDLEFFHKQPIGGGFIAERADTHDGNDAFRQMQFLNDTYKRIAYVKPEDLNIEGRIDAEGVKIDGIMKEGKVVETATDDQIEEAREARLVGKKDMTKSESKPKSSKKKQSRKKSPSEQEGTQEGE